MDILKKMWPYLLLCIVAFYLFPLGERYWGGDMDGEIILLLLAIPCICLISSLVYGVRNGFHLPFSLLAGAFFLPSIFLYYNYTAWVYAIGYAVISVIGNAIGSLFMKQRK